MSNSDMAAVTGSSGNEFEFCAVPPENRKGFWSLCIVWTGYVFVVVSMMIGGGLAAGLSFSEIIVATIIGNVFLGIIATLVSIVAGRENLSFALITKYSFGVQGSRIASFVVPVVNLGWYIVQAATYGHFIALIFKFGDVGEGICMFLSAIVMGVFAFRGMRAITILGYVSIPAIVFLCIATAIRATNDAGGIDQLFASTPIKPIGLGAGITVVIGTWILSTCTCIADIMRYAKTPKVAVGAAVTGLVGGNTLMIICGAITGIALSNSDLPEVLLTLGLAIPAIILMTTNIWTTNAANLYSNSLNLSNSFHMKREKMLIIALVLAAFLTLTKPYDIGFLFNALGFLGNFIPPLAGIIIADYFIIRKMKFPPLSSASFRYWNISAFLTWAIALALSFIIPILLPTINSLLVSIILYPVFEKIIPSRNQTAKGDAR